jgi:hypothetical protein
MMLPETSNILEVDATDRMAIAFMEATVAFTDGTQALQSELWRCCFPPWRWLRWGRLYREIRARHRLTEGRIEQSRAWRRAHAARTGVRYIWTQSERVGR